MLQNVRVLATIGDSLPGKDGTFRAADLAYMQNGDQVVFLGTYRIGEPPDSNGIFSIGTNGAGLKLLAREGQAVPGGDGVFGTLSSALFSMNSRNDVAFLSWHLEDTSESQGIFFWNAEKEELLTVVRSGQTAPGGTETFEALDAGEYAPILNDVGEIGFGAWLSESDQAIFKADTEKGGIIKIVKNGDTFEGLTIGSVWRERFSMNSSGDFAFTAAGDFGTALWIGDGSDNAPFVFQTEATPSGNGVFDVFERVNLRLNDQGEVAFANSLLGTTGGDSDNFGIFKWTGSELVEIVRKGDPTPDGNGTFQDLNSNIRFNNRGQVAFFSTIQGASDGATSGLFIGDGDSVTQIARISDPAPGGNTIGSLDWFFSLNDQGHVSFEAGIDFGDGGSTNDTFGIFYFDGEEILTVARQGDEIPGAGTLGFLRLYPNEFQMPQFEPERSPLNDRLQVTFVCELGPFPSLFIWSDVIGQGGFENN